MKKEEMQAVARRIQLQGPDRVVVDGLGELKSCVRAKREHEITATLAYIRDDGFTLGAPDHLHDIMKKHAEAFVEDDARTWVGIVTIKPDSELSAKPFKK